MAKSTIRHSIKFRKLCMRLKMPAPHVLGHLELLWMAANDFANPVLGGADDIEIAAEWDGEPGILANALVELEWLDATPDGKLCIHNYWEHCPKYVMDRVRMQKKRRGVTTETATAYDVSPTVRDQSLPTKSNPTEPNETQPNETQPNETQPSTTMPIQSEPQPTQRPRTRRNELESINAISASAIGDSAKLFNRGREMLVSDYVAKAIALTREACGESWWRDAFGKLYDHTASHADSAAWPDLLDAFQELENRVDKEIRVRKGFGELQNPGGFLNGHILNIMRKHRIRWLAFPTQWARATQAK